MATVYPAARNLCAAATYSKLRSNNHAQHWTPLAAPKHGGPANGARRSVWRPRITVAPRRVSASVLPILYFSTWQRRVVFLLTPPSHSRSPRAPRKRTACTPLYMYVCESKG
jgi:hypothetical protein